MNSYQNKNEILDTSTNNSNMSTLHPRYPLANDPYTSMRNTNYKEWLAMCADNKNNEQVPISPLDQEWRTVLPILFSAAASLTGLISVPTFGAISAGAALAAALTSILFPSQGPDVFNELMGATENLLKREIETYVRGRAASELLALEDQRAYFKSAFDYWRLHPTDGNAIATVAARFHTVNGAFVTAMRLFRPVGYEALLLPVYAQAAQYHLLHLRDGVLFADEWGLAKDPGDLHDQEFNAKAAEYADYCELTYNTELNRIKTTSGKTWFDYNQYRRLMTVAVLDVVAKFSILNPRIYRLALQEEILTRKIYTDPVNFSPGSSIAEDENRYTVPPSYVKQLVASTLYTNVASAQNAGFIGNRNRYLRIGDGEPFDGPLIGNSVYENVIAGIPTDAAVYEVGVNGIQNDYPRSIGLRKGLATDFQNFYAGSTYNLGSLTRVSVPPANKYPLDYSNFSHRLSDIILPGNKGSSFAWTHFDVDPTGNYLSTTKINLIPGTKSVTELQIIKGPGFIGGDLVRADYLNSSKSISFQLSSQSPGTRTSYRVRVRYGSSALGFVRFQFGDTRSEEQAISNLRLDTNNYKYNQFSVIEFFTTIENTTDSKIDIYFRGTSGGTFVLDRLELIPMTGIPTEYNEPQKLETAKKAVTDLFTN
ncbi:insecticidal delta-endotoxin Cry8Ea1 family protein [Bacillus thuringiensis]|uniref:insecticidal delta-endotoxin Cry8Ea1 family protein n=1 Tax=Bacillus thuringiensis TaxID=1428 RepID=UPI003D0EEF43|nr:insecticidal toxin protein [Bacillus thuringiensis]